MLCNSNLVMSTGSCSQFLSCGGQGGIKASIFMKNSSLIIDGYANFSRTNVCMWNSTISNASGATFPHEAIMFHSSNISLFRSFISGLASSNETTRFSAGCIISSGNPISSPQNIEFISSTAYGGKLIVDSLAFTIQVSGNNPYGDNCINVRLNGTSLARQEMPDTGSIYAKSILTFSVNLSYMHENLSSVLSSLTLYYNMSLGIGSNSTIWNLSARINSQDWVDRQGLQFNEIQVNNSSLVSYCSRIGINNGRMTFPSYLRNPLADFLLLTNGSIAYISGPFYSAIGNSSCVPVVVSGGSQAILASTVNISAFSGMVPLNGFNVSVKSCAVNTTLRSSASGWLNLINRKFGHVPGIQPFVHDGHAVIVLPNTALTETEGTTYLGTYNATIAGKSELISPLPVPTQGALTCNVTFLFSMALPQVSFLTTHLTAHSNSNITFRINRNYAFQYTIAASISIPAAGYFNQTVMELATVTAYLTVNVNIQHYMYTQNTNVYLNFTTSTETPHGFRTSMTFPVQVSNPVSIRVNSAFNTSSGVLCDSVFDLQSPIPINISLVIQDQASGAVIETVNIIDFSQSHQKNVSVFIGRSANMSVCSNLLLPQGYVNLCNTSIHYYVHPPAGYVVTFCENGLPAGMPWAINESGDIVISGLPVINFTLPNGTYNFSVPCIKGYETHLFSTAFRVEGSGVVVPVGFSAMLYAVRIIESGIPPDNCWSTMISNRVYTANTTVMLLQLPMGVYVFSPESTGDYIPATSTYILSVSGNTTVDISYRYAHPPFMSGFFDFITYNYDGISALALMLILVVEYWRLRSGVFLPGSTGSKNEK